MTRGPCDSPPVLAVDQPAIAIDEAGSTKVVEQAVGHGVTRRRVAVDLAHLELLDTTVLGELGCELQSGRARCRRSRDVNPVGSRMNVRTFPGLEHQQSKYRPAGHPAVPVSGQASSAHPDDSRTGPGGRYWRVTNCRPPWRGRGDEPGELGTVVTAGGVSRNFIGPSRSISTDADFDVSTAVETDGGEVFGQPGTERCSPRPGSRP